MGHRADHTTSRSRWAAVGAALAISVGGGGVLISSAADSTPPSSFVAITPCRLIDTRPGTDNVGTRSTPLGAGETFTASVTGSNGSCSLPTDATAVSMNVTVIGPTAASYLTVFPADASRPVSANLNWVAGQAPTPNAVTSDLSSDGKVSFYNLSGTVNVAVDVVGYYVAAGASDPAQVVTVATSGGDYTSLSSALASITDASTTKRYVVRVAPGTYTETQTLSLKSYVDIEGAGTGLTTITCACSNPTTGSSTMRVVGPGVVTEVRSLTIANTGGGTDSNAVYADAVAPHEVVLQDVRLEASGGSTLTNGLFARNSHLTLDDSSARATGTSANAGLFAEGGTVEMNGTDLVAHGGAQNYGLFADDGANIDMEHSSADASGITTSTTSVGIYAQSSDLELDDVLASGSGGHSARGLFSMSSTLDFMNGYVVALEGATSNTGITVENGSGTLWLVEAEADDALATGVAVLGTAEVDADDIQVVTGGVSAAYGIKVADTGSLRLRASEVVTTVPSIHNIASVSGNVLVAGTQLDTFVTGTQPVHCITSYTTAFAVLNATCTAVAP